MTILAKLTLMAMAALLCLAAFAGYLDPAMAVLLENVRLCS